MNRFNIEDYFPGGNGGLWSRSRTSKNLKVDGEDSDNGDGTYDGLSPRTKLL